MKKVILSFLMIFSAVLMTSQLLADETTETGNLVVHYQGLTDDYSLVGLNSWGHKDSGLPGGVQNPAALENITKTDGFGLYWELNDLPVTEEGSIGFQVVGFPAVDAGTPNWDTQKYANHEILNSVIVAGETVHVYMLHGSNTRTNDEGLDEPIPYMVTKPTERNVVLVYFDQSNAYDENLGLHNWGWTSSNAAGWANPNKVLETVGVDSSGTPILGTVLTYAATVTPATVGASDIGFIVYAGGDDSKKTGDVKLSELFSEETPNADVGEADVVQVYNAGNANTSNENVILNDGSTFIENAYAFSFVPMSVADNGERVGTFAPTANQVRVQLNTDIKVIDSEEPDAELEDAEKVALLKEWFTVKDAAGTEIAITDIDFDTAAASVSSFVLILDGSIDNTKEYTLAFEDANRTTQIALDIDKTGPEIVFLGNDWEGVAVEDRVITVAWDEKFDYNLFPGFIAVDDRDGDVTQLVYVPSGDFSTLNTNVVGDYTIMLRVADAWGNVTEEKFIFRVEKK